MNYQLISVGVLLLFCFGGSLALLSRRPDWLLLLIVIGLGFGGFNVYYVSTIWTPVKLVTAFGLIYIFFIDCSWIKEINISKNRIIWAICCSVIFSMFIGYFTSPESTHTYDTNLQGGSLRPFVQAYAYISKLAIFPLTLLAIQHKKDIKIFFDIYIWTAIIVSLIALYQLIILQAGGSFMPILRNLNEHHSPEAVFYVAGLRLQRLYAFAGEPKTLAAFLLPAIFAVLSSITIKVPFHKPKWSKVWVLLVLTFVYVFTFSSAGLIALVLGVLFIGAILNKVQSTAITKIALVTILASFTLQWAFNNVILQHNSLTSDRSSVDFADVFYQRSIGRVSDELETRYEYIAINYVWNEAPLALPLGLGPGMYNFHISELHYKRGVQQINSGWIVLLLDTGIAGTLLVIYWLFGIVRRGLRMSSWWLRNADYKAVCLITPAIASLVAAIFGNLGINTFESIVLFSGVIEAMRLRTE